MKTLQSIRMVSRLVSCALLLLAAAGIAAAQGAAKAEPQSSFTIGELFRMEDLIGSLLGPPALSPDGQWIAYAIRRPMGSSSINFESLHGNERADICVVSIHGGNTITVPRSAMPGSGNWHPVWSPDSKSLAYQSNQEAHVRVFVWSRGSQRTWQVSDRDVEVVQPLLWVSNSTLMYATMSKAISYDSTISQQHATAEWSTARVGKEPTSSVLESGVPSEYSQRLKGAIIVANPEKQESNIFAEGNFSNLIVSPDQRHLAALEQVDVIQPRADVKLPHILLAKNQLAVFTLDGKKLTLPTIDANILSGRAIHWAPNSREIALTALTDRRVDVYRIAVDKLTATNATVGLLTLGPQTLDFLDLVYEKGLLWNSSGDLILKARPVQSGTNMGSDRSDWWLLPVAGAPQNLTASLASVPAQLIANRDGSDLEGVANGKLWKISTDGSPAVAMVEREGSQIVDSPWPGREEREVNTFSNMIIERKTADRVTLEDVNLRTGYTRQIGLPEGQANLSSYDATAGIALYKVTVESDSSLWSGDTSGRTQSIATANAFLRDVPSVVLKQFTYRGLDGRPLKAGLLLPNDYKEGHRYPTITYVYAGSMMGEDPLGYAGLNFASALNVRLLITLGYGVLLPDMPLTARGDTSEPLLELTNGVLPAIDRAVELGYTDPDRVGVMGHSYGGYSTLGLITQTTRFRAAVELAGSSDLVSQYGSFVGNQRYNEHAHEETFEQSIAESSQDRMGSPPWRDLGRYLRNSPISYIERVQTPLLMIQGDFDHPVPMQQADEVFSSLYRQAKRASYVRYWGEGHLVSSPANIRDMWYRIFAWFDEFMDVSRDQQGNMLWDGKNLRSRGSASPLKPKDFDRFDKAKTN